MKAIRFHQTGEPACVLNVEDVERPKPRHGEVLVRMLASPVNPSDLMFIRGRYTTSATCPATPGFEGVGIVEASGGGLRGKLFRGKRVAVLNRAGGNWAEYVVVPASQVIPLGRSLTDDQAATFFVNPATAWIMTQHVLNIPPGAWLVQSAAGSSLGRMIVRLGKYCGFRTFNLVRRQEVADDLRAMGADHVEVCDGSASALEAAGQAIRGVISPSGGLFVIDAVGGETGSALVQHLAPRGRMLAFGTLSNQPFQFSPRTLMTAGSSVEGFWLGNFMEQRGLLFKLRLVRRLTRLITTGVLDSDIHQSLPLDEIATAVSHAEDSSVRGKVVLRLQHSDK